MKTEIVLAYPAVKSLGRASASMWILGRNPVHQDLKNKLAFQSGFGFEFATCCREAGLNWGSTFRTNMINHTPPWDSFSPFLVTKTELKKWELSPREIEILGPISKTKYLHPALLPELQELLGLIRREQPNLIFGLGAEVCNWLTGEQSLEGVRGFITDMKLIPGQKVLCSYHPASILAQWSNRPILIADLMKGWRESKFAGIRKTHRRILLPENLLELEKYLSEIPEEDLISIDIETLPNLRLIRSLGLSHRSDEALVIPFVDFTQENGSYWNQETELEIWAALRDFFSGPNPKVGQNFLYDVQWLYQEAGIRMNNFCHDTMINHHVLYPEMKKSLAFQASLYLDEQIWKGMVKHDIGEKPDG